MFGCLSGAHRTVGALLARNADGIDEIWMGYHAVVMGMLNAGIEEIERTNVAGKSSTGFFWGPDAAPIDVA